MARHDVALALSGPVDGRAGNLGRDFLDPAPPLRAGDVRRAADRPRLGGEHDLHCLLFVVEMILGLPVLTLSPVLALTSGMVFLVKAGTLTGQFYFQSAALFATALAMAALERMHIDLGITLFGIVSAGCFFFPGLKYYRQRNVSRSPRCIQSVQALRLTLQQGVAPISSERVPLRSLFG